MRIRDRNSGQEAAPLPCGSLTLEPNASAGLGSAAT